MLLHEHIQTAQDFQEAANREFEAGEYNDPFIEAAFGVAEEFHANFYHDFMESEERQSSAASVRLLVTRLTAMTDDDRNRSDQSQ